MGSGEAPHPLQTQAALTPQRGREAAPCRGTPDRGRLEDALGPQALPASAPLGGSPGCPNPQGAGTPARRRCSKAAVATRASSSGGGAARRHARLARCRERQALCSFPTKNPEASCVYANHNPLRGSCIYKLRHVEIKGDTI